MTFSDMAKSLFLLSMRVCLLALGLSGGVGSMRAAKVGDTLEAVLAEKGKPVSRAELGDAVILNYPDMSIHLRQGAVTEVKAKSAVRPIPPKPTAAPKKPASLAAGSKLGPVTSGWLTSFPQAREEAKASGRRILLFFTGSDWSEPSKKLKSEVLDTPQFMAYAEEKLILVEFDFPKAQSISPDLRQQTVEMAQAFGVRAFPTLVVLGPDLKPLASYGYEEGGPAGYIASIEGL